MTLVEAIIFVGLVAYATVLIVDRSVDQFFVLRRVLRQRRGESGRSFAVMPQPALPYEGDGPGVYRVEGVLERTGTRTLLRIDAASRAEAFRDAVERGVLPAEVTKHLSPAAAA